MSHKENITAKIITTWGKLFNISANMTGYDPCVEDPTEYVKAK